MLCRQDVSLDASQMFQNVTFACDLVQEAPRGPVELLSSESCAAIPISVQYLWLF